MVGYREEFGLLFTLVLVLSFQLFNVCKLFQCLSESVTASDINTEVKKGIERVTIVVAFAAVDP